MPSSRPEPGQSLADLRPDLAAEWDQEKNGELTPWDVKCGSGKKVWWKCKFEHEWPATIKDRTINNSSCPYCVGKKQELVIGAEGKTYYI